MRYEEAPKIKYPRSCHAQTSKLLQKNRPNGSSSSISIERGRGEPGEARKSLLRPSKCRSPRFYTSPVSTAYCTPRRPPFHPPHAPSSMVHNAGFSPPRTRPAWLSDPRFELGQREKRAALGCGPPVDLATTGGGLPPSNEPKRGRKKEIFLHPEPRAGASWGVGRGMTSRPGRHA
jgi:hypothetical protein